MKRTPANCALIMTSLSLAISANASWDSFIGDSSLDTKVKMNLYNIGGSYNYSLVDLPVTGKNKIKMDEMGMSLWMDWQSGYINDMFGMQLGYQSGGPNLYNNGYVRAENSMLPGSINSDYARFYEGTADREMIGKVSNANVQMRH